MTDERPPWAERLRAEREARTWTQVKMAIKLHEAAGQNYPPLKSLERQVRGWEAGDHYPDPEWRGAYSIAFGLSEAKLFGSSISSGGGVSREEEEEDVERRRMLQALAALGVASVSPVAEAVQIIRGYVEKNLGRDPSSQMDEWEQTVSDHGYGYLSIPPAQLVGELAADLVSVHSFTPRIREGHPQYSRWCRVTGGLAWLMAKTLCNLGHIQESRTWWRTAQHAADASGDVDLSLWVSGERMIRGLYEQRPAAVLLRQAAEAAARQRKHPCGGLAHVRTLQAQVFALVGRADDAVQELGRAEAVFAQLPAEVTSDAGSTWCWGEDRLRYTEAWVHAHLGDTAQLDAATNRALELLEYTDPRSATQIKLVQAFGHVRAGDVTEGVRLASSTYEAWPAEQRTTIVGRLAGEVWNAVPVAQRRDPSVAAYRELVASSSSRKEIT
jgi:transcriptional regulator with XRE-family HTH domain